MIGYHFTADKLRNGCPLPPVGTTLYYYGEVVPCAKGLGWEPLPDEEE